MKIDELVEAAAKMRASDIHIVRGIPIRIRVDGSLTDFGGLPLTAAECEDYALQIDGERAKSLATGEIDLARTYAGQRCRINLFRQQDCFSAAIRILNNHIPSLAELNLPKVISSMPDYPRGIVLVTGETGSGKSTTLAAMLDQINHSRKDHIITLEDPIEYVYTPDRCVINQREIGKDTASFSDGLRASLREDPDVILVGEMRDYDTMDTALTAAETGHLVFGTLHTNSAADSIDRIVNSFPEGRQRQIRMQLSMTLKAVISQQLLPRYGAEGRAAACEIMIVNAAIRNLIREGKTPQIQNVIATNASEGSITMDNQLALMVSNGTISPKVAMDSAQDADYLRRFIHI